MVASAWWMVAVLVAGTEPEPEPEAVSTASPAEAVPAATIPAAEIPAGTATEDPAAAVTTSAVVPAPDGRPLADSAPVLLLRREEPGGGATERWIEPSGDVVVHVVGPAGTVESCEKVGSLFTLPLVRQEQAANGEVVAVGRDESGALVRWVVQADDGEPRAVSLLPGALR